MFAPGLVASDLDGTLLDSELRVSDRTLAALRGLRAVGIPLVLVTGRPRRWLMPVLEQTGPVGPIVCGNGSLVVDETNERVLAEWPIAAGLLAEMTAALRETVPNLVFAVESGPLMLHEADYPIRWDLALEQERAVVDLAELCAQGASKLLIRCLDGDPDARYRQVAAALDGTLTPTHSGSPGLVEVTAAGVTKASGLAWAAAHHGVPAERVLAFGDMPNDAPMLRWAGRGVVVAGAHPDALAAADAVTLSNDADGVAAYIEAMLESR